MNAAERKLVQEPAEAALRKAGWGVYRTQHASRKGWPDDVAHRRGRVVYIEFKNPDGGVVSPHQQELHAELRAYGIEVFLASSVNDLTTLLSEDDG